MSEFALYGFLAVGWAAVIMLAFLLGVLRRTLVELREAQQQLPQALKPYTHLPGQLSAFNSLPSKLDDLEATAKRVEAYTAQLDSLASNSAAALSLLTQAKLPNEAARVMWVPDETRAAYDAKVADIVREGIFFAEHTAEVNARAGTQRSGAERQRLAMLHAEGELQKLSVPIERHDLAKRIEVELSKLKAEGRVDKLKASKK